MNAYIQWALSDRNIDTAHPSSQRQASITVQALPGRHRPPLNLCLVLDQSGSMAGDAMETIRAAAKNIVDGLSAQDRLSIVAFDHKARLVVPNQAVLKPLELHQAIDGIRSGGGTCIDAGLNLAIEALGSGAKNRVSQIFLLTDGENEHGDNSRCLQLAKQAAEYAYTVNTLGFGDYWNQDTLEAIADVGGGHLTYVRNPAGATAAFERLLEQVKAVGVTNAHLLLNLSPGVALARLKPVAQVLPDVVELPTHQAGQHVRVRLGDLMTNAARVVLANFYVPQLEVGRWPVMKLRLQYDAPGLKTYGLQTDWTTVSVDAVSAYAPEPNAAVQQHILALAKYRQTKIAETRLGAGDQAGAITMLQSAAKTAIQLDDKAAITVLQETITSLQRGQPLSPQAQKRTRLVAKTALR